ncbi:hypothetical protein GCM10010327_61260 [Streptomyces nitrosporeus]|nr:hypothetical protein GCM10010327_61260 [Streptomyces nitrosporeus]
MASVTEEELSEDVACAALRAPPRTRLPHKRRLFRGLVGRSRMGGTASSRGRSRVTSWRLAPVSVTADGAPWRSTIRFRGSDV